ncbi:DUF4097 family beta strand repeat protein [Treponema sp. OMZ 792]|uniref:DUF4097 domain-containing protein n=1 Tax=unclassified Treponema TaxID=2638727 RepID=UPI0020A61B2E|nr:MULTISPECIES: DUF4097 domain-containing protein [unclassified Treponema]UTC75578.1 DUF4097 family beta strand repeat protein [Treponema sp. OMZ 792]UTC79580.1 DUF4097 domain-containing protein [Treponema sp. OMZ 798]
MQRLKCRLFLGLCFFSLFYGSALFSQDIENLTKVQKRVVNIEAAVSEVDVFISSYDGDTIAYRTELKSGTKLSIVEHKKKLRFTEIRPASGKLFIYVPKDFLLESCRVLASHSSIKIEGIKAVHFSASGNFNKAEITGSRLKNSLIALSNGSLTFNNGIVSAADFCLNFSKAKIEIAEEKEHCNLFVTQQKCEKFIYAGEAYTDRLLALSPPKPKKFISMSASFSDIDLGFSAPLKEPREKFDKYGVSEFGPKLSPNLVDNEANFLPKTSTSLP